MKGDNKAAAWLKSDKSDRVLLIVAIVLLLLVCNRAYIRLDLTKSRSFSLSPASREVVHTLPERLSVKVYFSDNLPSRYAAVEQYLLDLLVEYKGAANKNFSYTIADMKKTESESEAAQFGLRQIQIQEVKNNEIGFKTGYMGLVMSYMDQVDVIDGITSTASLEYSITTKISSMIQKADALSVLGTDEKILLTLYMTDELGAFGIAGFDDIESVVSKAAAELDKQSMGRVSYHKVSPPMTDMQSLNDRYGVQLINWQKADGSLGLGVLGLVIESGEKSRLVPLTMERGLFGYVISGLDNMEKSLSDNLTALVSKVTKVGYITGHSEAALYNQNGDNPLVSITRDMYSLEDLDLTESDIPSDIGAVVINGPKSEFNQEELYRLDQFVMRGGSVMFLLDPFSEQSNWGGAPATYTPIDSGLGKLLNAYGAQVNTDYVMDEECYVSMTQQYGDMKLYYAPLLQKKQLSSSSPVTRNLGNVLFYKSASVDVDAAMGDKDVVVDVLAKTSPAAWTQTENITLNPLMTYPPSDKSKEGVYNLAVMMEGKFKSAFDSAPKANGGENNGDGDITTTTHKAQSVQKGRIFIAGTSEIAGDQLVDAKGEEPIAMFTRNALDYVCGNGELCTMRTKGLSINTLHDKGSAMALLMKYFNQYGIAVLSILAAFILWRRRQAKRRIVHDKYNPNDTRTVGKSKE